MNSDYSPNAGLSVVAREEAERLCVDVLYSKNGHFAAAASARNVHLGLGIPAIICGAAVGTATVLGIGHVLAPILGYAAATLSAIATFTNPSDRAAKHHRAGVLFAGLHRRIRQFVRVQSRTLTDDDLSRAVVKYSNEANSIQSGSPPIPGRAYRKAKRSIESGGADYTPEEIRHALGEHAN